jgi:hypothetical protein
MTRTIWNKTTQTYTVSNGSVIVRNIPVKPMAVCVAMEVRNGFNISFGDVEVR